MSENHVITYCHGTRGKGCFHAVCSCGWKTLTYTSMSRPAELGKEHVQENRQPLSLEKQIYLEVPTSKGILAGSES